MVLPTPPYNPNTPIPNNPFFAPEATWIEGPYYPAGITSSSGATVNQDGTIVVTGGGGGSGTVSNVTGISPISVTSGTTTPLISIGSASITGAGVVQLVNNTFTNDPTKSLTAAQGFSLQQQIDNLSPAGGLFMAGSFDAAGSQLLAVTGAGSSATPPFVVGSDLPFPSPANQDYFVIVTTPGSYTPPGTAGPLTLNQGDWLLSTGTSWLQLAVGYSTANASTSNAGLVRLATTAETQAGTNSAIAVTPAGACQTYIQRCCVTAKGALIAGLGPSNPGTFGIGATGQVLMVDPSTSSGMRWTTIATTNGTVTSVGAGNALSGGPIITTGALDLKTQTLTPGTYTDTTVCVNCYGVITSVSNGSLNIPVSDITGKGVLITGTNPATPTALPLGLDTQELRACSDCVSGLTWANTCLGTVTNVSGSAPFSVTTATTTPVVSIATATTSALGVTQLVNNLTTNDSANALTAAQGCALQQQINNLVAAGPSNLSLAGTFDASSGLVLTVTAPGSTAGFTVSNPVPSPAPGNADFFVIATTGGTSYSPPGGGGPYSVSQGDWIYSNGTQWVHLNIGTDLPTASASSAGIVQLATNAQTITGTNSTVAVTPAGAAAAYVPLSCFTGVGALVAGTAASTAGTLTLGTNGQILVIDTACTTGLKWSTETTGSVTSITAGTGLSGGTINTSGTIALPVTGITAGTYSYPAITVNDTGIITSIASGDAPVLCCTATTKGDLLAATAAGALGSLGVGANGEILTASSGCTTGLTWTPESSLGLLLCCSLTAKGTLITASSASNPTALAVGTDGHLLAPDSTCTGGLTWRAPALGTVTSITAGTGLTTGGGPITQAGTISLSNVGTAGTYNSPSVSVDQQGRITSATSQAGNWVNAGKALPATVRLTDGTVVFTVDSQFSQNVVYYRQIKSKMYDIVYVIALAQNLFPVLVVADLLFPLPAGLNFDMTVPSQSQWTGGVAIRSQEHRKYWIPGASCTQIGVSSGAGVYSNGVAVWDSPSFRVFATDQGNSAPQAVGPLYYSNAGVKMTIGFRFVST